MYFRHFMSVPFVALCDKCDKGRFSVALSFLVGLYLVAIIVSHSHSHSRKVPP